MSQAGDKLPPPEIQNRSSADDFEDGQEKKNDQKKVRTGDKTNEQIFIPKNRLVVVFIGIMLTVFLAALDQTIVCMLLWMSNN